ncbi:MAG: glycosyltransferase family 4 protein, partial [Acidimicrobiales bacterium]
MSDRLSKFGRILMVSPYDVSVPGGVQGQVLGLSRALGDLGHEVTVVAPTSASPLQDVEVLSMGAPRPVRANGSVAPVSLSPRAALAAGRSSRGTDVGIVHLHEPLAPLLNYGCLLAARAPIVGTFHRSGPSGLYRALKPAVRWVGSRLSARCAVSEAARATAAPWVGGSWDLLFNAVAMEAVPRASRDDGGHPVILFVGRHEPRKGLGVLLDAFSSSRLDARLWVAGEGPLSAELMRRYPGSETLRWLGRITEAEKNEAMAAAQILCAPSIGGESFGVVLLEAMAAGLAVVASDIEGYRSAAGGHALLVPPGDARGLGEALRSA